MSWLLLILSLPTENAMARMRAWRALKTLGAVSLRDGVYLLPSNDDHRERLKGIADGVRNNRGNTYLLDAEGPKTEEFAALFERSEEYEALHMEIVECRARLSRESAFEVLKEARKLRKGFVRLSAIDFFPKATQQQADAALQELETAANQALSPDEPYPEPRTIERLDRADYQGRLWATRHRPWVDRQASAWPLHCDLCQRRE